MSVTNGLTPVAWGSQPWGSGPWGGNYWVDVDPTTQTTWTLIQVLQH